MALLLKDLKTKISSNLFQHDVCTIGDDIQADISYISIHLHLKISILRSSASRINQQI